MSVLFVPGSAEVGPLPPRVPTGTGVDLTIFFAGWVVLELGLIALTLSAVMAVRRHERWGPFSLAENLGAGLLLACSGAVLMLLAPLGAHTSWPSITTGSHVLAISGATVAAAAVFALLASLLVSPVREEQS